MKKIFSLLAAVLCAASMMATDLYVVGTLNSWSNGSAAWAMTETVTDAEWTFDFGTTDLAGQQFKITDGDWVSPYNLGSSSTLIPGTITLTEGGSNISLNAQYNSATGVVITLAKDSEGNFTLTAAGTFTTGERQIPALYLRGGDDAAWSASEAHKFAKTEGQNEWNLTLTVDPSTFGAFKVADANWGDYNFGAGATALAIGEAYTLVKGSNTNLTLPATAAAGEYGFKLTKAEEVWSLLVTTTAAPVDTVPVDPIDTVVPPVDPVIPTAVYMKHPWDGENWTWKALKDSTMLVNGVNMPGFYVNNNWYGTGVNVNAAASDEGAAWFPASKIQFITTDTLTQQYVAATEPATGTWATFIYSAVPSDTVLVWYETVASEQPEDTTVTPVDPQPAHTYALAGDFNSWGTPVAFEGNSLSYTIPAGQHDIKIVVDGTDWKGMEIVNTECSSEGLSESDATWKNIRFTLQEAAEITVTIGEDGLACITGPFYVRTITRETFTFHAGATAEADPAFFIMTSLTTGDPSAETIKMTAGENGIYTAEIDSESQSFYIVRCATGAEGIEWYQSEAVPGNVWNGSGWYAKEAAEYWFVGFNAENGWLMDLSAEAPVEPTTYTVNVTINNMDPDTYLDDAGVYVSSDDEENPFAPLAEGANTVDAGRTLILTASTEGVDREFVITVNGDTVTLDESQMYTIASLSEDLVIVFTFLNPEPGPGPEPEPVEGSGLFVVGTMNSWTVAMPAYELTTVTEGAQWTFDFGAAELVGQQFKITDATLSNWSDATINLGIGADKLTEGTIALVDGSSVNISVADNYNSATNVVITLTYVEGAWTLSAAGTFVEGEKQIPDLYLRGGDDASWGAPEAHKFTKTEGQNEWVLTLTVDPTAFGAFKIADAAWGDYNFGAGENALVLGEAYTLYNGGNADIALPASAVAGEYTFTLTMAENVWTLTVTVVEPEPEPVVLRDLVFVPGVLADADATMFLYYKSETLTEEHLKMTKNTEGNFAAQYNAAADQVMIVRCAADAEDVIWGGNVWNGSGWISPCDTIYYDGTFREDGWTFNTTCVAPVEPEPEPVEGSGLFVVGTMNSWTVAMPAYELTTVTEGAQWTFDFGAAELVGQQFKITDATLSNWSDATINLGIGADKLTEGTIALVDGSSVNISVADNYNSATNVVITLTYAEGAWTLSAAGTFVEGEKQIPDLYLRGGDDASWGAPEAHKFTKTEGQNEWVLTLTVDPTAFGAFKIADAAWGDYNFGAGENALVLGEAYTLYNGGNADIALPASAVAGEYTFTLTMAENVWTLTVTVKAEPEPTNLMNLFNGEKAVKVVENGKVVIIRNGVKYNAQGVKF